MADKDEEEPNPIDQLVDLFVYAPVGLLYEYPEVLPKLIKRGKSQVQLARVVSQLALRGRDADIDVNDVAGVAATLIGRAVNEFGGMVERALEQQPLGAPPPPAPRPPAPRPPPPAKVDEPTDADDADEAVEPALPIAGYDELKAREIIPMLDNLSAAERTTIRAHEEAGRSRKTVLAKLDRLDT